MNKNKKRFLLSAAKFSIFIAVFLVLILATVLLSKWMRNNSKKTTLPKVSVFLDGVDLETVHAGTKDIKYPGNYVVLNNDGTITDYEDVELKGRGNSTWGWEKSPYQLKFSEKVDFLGMGAAKKWIFLANYFDMSNLRTAAAFKLESILGEEYALSGHFAELSIDDDWRGLYYITEKIGVGKDRVNLKDPYGLVVELENLHTENEECYYTKKQTCLEIKDSVDEDNEEEAMEKFVEQFGEVEVAAKNRDYEKVKELMDVESLAKYYLLSEFTANPDSFVSSWYFYQDGPDDKIHVGPGWDYDYAMGNKLWIWNVTDDLYLPETDMLEIITLGGDIYDDASSEVIKASGSNDSSKMVYYLLEVPEFKNLVRQTYLETMFGRRDEVLIHLKILAGQIRNAAISDFSRFDEGRDLLWKTLGEEVYNGFEPEEGFDYASAYIYDSEVKYLIDWVARRFDYLDEKYSLNRDKIISVI